MLQAKELGRGAARSWTTLAIGMAAGLAFAWPAAAGGLIFVRTDILAGQLWRLWTGHLVHFTANHLLWDLAVFLPAGVWLEWVTPRGARWFYLLAPPTISLLLFFSDPALSRYAGLSGLATGLLVLLALVQLQRDAHEPAWFWLGVLLLVAVKIVVESVTHAPLVVRFDVEVRTVPLAHIGGVGCAVAAFLIWRQSARRRAA
ncbi:MAG TPA: rhombosortase [Opitutaceae bacterium]|nr:rhombosortase [Opitutaceae bacterium]